MHFFFETNAVGWAGLGLGLGLGWPWTGLGLGWFGLGWPWTGLGLGWFGLGFLHSVVNPCTKNARFRAYKLEPKPKQCSGLEGQCDRTTCD